MIFIFGPLWSGKRTEAQRILGCDEAELARRAVWDVQELTRESEDVEALADMLSRKELVIATEVGGGVVPADPEERAARERAGRLNCLLAERADTVVRVFCGIPMVLKGGASMNIWLLRHGRTRFNDERRYQGQLDIPLSPAGEAELTQAEFRPKCVYVSPLCRSQQTAGIVFPDARQIVIDDFAEMDFGVFDGRTADEMANDPAYRAWVDGDCTAQCPGGESRAAFCDRSCSAFACLLEQHRDEDLVIVAHGGTLRAVMERYALPEKGYFDWMSGNGGGYRLTYDEVLWREKHKLRLAERVRFVREEIPC